jgi:hypothetical protein
LLSFFDGGFVFVFIGCFDLLSFALLCFAISVCEYAQKTGMRRCPHQQRRCMIVDTSPRVAMAVVNSKPTSEWRLISIPVKCNQMDFRICLGTSSGPPQPVVNITTATSSKPRQRALDMTIACSCTTTMAMVARGGRADR